MCKCAVSENIYTFPWKRFFLLHPPLNPLEIPVSFTHFFKFWNLTDLPKPRKFQYLMWREYRYVLELFNGSTLLRLVSLSTEL